MKGPKCPKCGKPMSIMSVDKSVTWQYRVVFYCTNHISQKRFKPHGCGNDEPIVIEMSKEEFKSLE